MATRLSTCFLSHGFFAAFNYDCSSSNVRFLLPSYRLLPASCKMRHRNLSSNHRRQQAKKAVPQRPKADFQSSKEEDSDGETSTPLTVPSLDREFVPDDDVSSPGINAEGGSLDEIASKNDVVSGNAIDAEGSDDVDVEHVQHNDVDGETSTPLTVPSLDHEFVPDDDVSSPKTNAEGGGVDEIASKNDVVSGNGIDAEDSDAVEVEHVQHNDVDHLESLTVTDHTKSLDINIDGKEPLPTYQLEDLIGMIRSAEKNVLLLNQARVRALEDLDRILTEKEAFQGEINVLQMKLAETDARMQVAAQEKIHVELLEEQLEKLRHELAQRGSAQGAVIDLNENHEKVLNEEASSVHNSSYHLLNEELSTLKAENVALKNDIEALKEKLNNIKNTDERVITLEKERMLLESSLKDLETKLAASQEDVSKLSHLKVECKDLWEKVENLQALLDKATKQADQAIIVLQQNQELRKKVDKLEESVEEASVYKLSSEKLQQYNELMQQKINLLEERLERSDEEIHSYIQLYQDSVQEFQDTLNNLKEESKKRALDLPVEDLPWEFWSRVLLIIDGWLLEKKITADDAKTLREMVWKRDRRIRDAYMESREKNEREALSTFLKLTSLTTSSGLYVVHIAAEMAPVAKVGGLGDVVTGLGKALQKRGHLVEIVLPKYDCMQYDRIGDLRALDVTVESYFNGKLYKNKIWVGTIEGLPVYFIEPHHPDKFFWRGQYYGEHDDFKRFSFFSRAALELLLQAGKKPDIIHCHDWQTAFVAPLYWDIYAPKGLNSARICFTCHNFEYQGAAPASELASCGLDVQQMNRPDRMQDNSSHDRINPVKGAVVFSNIVTTVSPTYAQEVRTAEGGKGLHSTLNFHSKKFIGILNGIDTDAWNPATDSFLKVQYNANDLQGKAENKLYARKHLRLSTSDARQPLVGCITRLVPQKGVHLIRHAIYRTLELGGQFVLLGSSPVPHIQREFDGMASNFQNHDHVRLILKYDESLSHSIFAASDLFIIPSIFEPCGLTQMIAMRYGSIPIARKTGGLNDSVFDIDDDTIPLQFRNGFTFLNPDEQGLSGALERAFNYYRNNPEGWQQLVQKDMRIDFSWDSSASQYEELYSMSVARARAAANRP